MSQITCMELRRLRLIAPLESSAAQDEHLSGCPACADFARRLEAQEGEIEEAMRVPVPDTLADRVILAQQLQGQAPRWNRGLMALAATMIMGVGVTTAYLQILQPREVALAAISHVAREPDALQVRYQINDADVREALAFGGGQLVRTIGQATHLTPCEIEGQAGRHIVFDTPEGQVTLLLIPGGKAVPRPVRVSEGGYSALIVPVGRGNVGIVTDSPDRLERAEDLINSGIRWKT